MKEFTKQIQNRFDEMSKTGKLFRSSLTGQQIWDMYIASFLVRDQSGQLVHSSNG